MASIVLLHCFITIPKFACICNTARLNYILHMVISFLDYILLPFYILLFYFFTRRLANKLNDPELKKIMLNAFWLRMLGTIAYCMVVQYYYGYGDSITYYAGAQFFLARISEDFGSLSYLFAPFEEMESLYLMYSNNAGFTGYFSAPASNMVMRIATLFSYISFNSFVIISLFFGMFSFLGQWKLFKVFDAVNKQRSRKVVALAVLYTPSIWFWGSGLLKDSICLGSLGLIIHILYKFFARKKFSFTNLVFLVVLVFIVNVIKSYIVTIAAVGLAVMFFALFLKSIKIKILRMALTFFAFVAFAVLFYAGDFTGQINDIAAESLEQIEYFQKNYQASSDSDESSKSGFGIGEVSASPAALLLKSPLVIFTCLFRPFVLESRKVFILFTSLETTSFLILTLYLMFKIGFINFFRKIFASPSMVFCFTLSILFALVIGFTTFNFGTMIRYKIIFLPFFYFMLVHLYTHHVLKKVPKSNMPIPANMLNASSTNTTLS